MKRFLTLVRRELWEHHALWVAPVAVSILMLLGTAFGRGMSIAHDSMGVALPQDLSRAIFAVAVVGFGLAQYVTMSVVLWFYATRCLYDERGDRSILFWRSLPVSDNETILSKATVAIVVAPAIVFVVAALSSLVAFGIFSVRGFGAEAPIQALWSTRTWLDIEGDTVLALIFATLWYAPVTAYLMLVSAWARRNVQVWVILPPLVAVILERLVVGTHYLSTILLYRLGRGWESDLVISIERVFTGPALGPAGFPTRPSFTSGGSVSHALAQAYGNIDLWIGLAVAAALFYAAARIRRYRDET